MPTAALSLRDRPPVRAALLLLLTLLLVTLGASAGHGQSRGDSSGAPVPFAAMERGGLFLPSELPGHVLPATSVDSTVAISVSGLVARARITQRFRNPTDRWVEGVYVFPLPETAAVDRLRLIVGERAVEGEIREREAAQRAYAQAREAGQRASLVSQERPNIFTNAVANIAPHDAVTVEIEYQQTLRFDQGAFSLRFPMVVLPRYIPGRPAETGIAGQGWAFNTDRVPDASRITPPVAAPDAGPVNPVTLSVELDPGFPVAAIDSPYHPIAVQEQDQNRFLITLGQGRVWADRDFELVWRPAPSATPTAGVFSETAAGSDYHLLLVMPPAAAAGAAGPDAGTPRAPAVPREIVFIIDSSGSMAGQSILQARQALLYALGRLGPQDRFNVIDFDNEARPLFAKARPATPEALQEGRDFVRRLEADGGTEMRKALELALTGEHDPGRLRQVVFITDGSVGNEAELFGFIRERLGDTRLFTVGIGSAPNSFFMREAAAAGRGDFIHIGATAEVGEKMAGLFQKLEHPALTDLHIAWPGDDGNDHRAEMYPAALPDLYQGAPVVATVRLPSGLSGMVTVSGRIAGRPWEARIALDTGRTSPGVAALWARDRITELERQRFAGADAKEIRRQIVAVALAHRLVSAYTSLVAIDDAVVRPPETGLSTDPVAVNMPHGVEMQMARAAPAAARHADRGTTLPAAAVRSEAAEAAADAASAALPARAPAPQPAPAASPGEDSLAAIRALAAGGGAAVQQGQPVQATTLPATATPATFNLLLGALCLAAAALLVWLARRLAPKTLRPLP